ncbi:hypothetical protein [Staphylococcus agnetis]|uniref:hypothetical protein n=1 Tax=Staphylococcus agnetis TaxID=985762 RepID=UPI0018E57696|nr:hypothetical protein [Staphylococcus agnetis]MCO4325631.1 hypothetical protein [Staphylococcus agnetis]MCO4356466.1 hypothetical protein [Staphylococcus agnetis]MCO4362950.1 hypothetical protein [Staphylococcus agnetis]MCO4369388.1 hypothetical protein [Staphylococcus agnetis]
MYTLSVPVPVYVCVTGAVAATVAKEVVAALKLTERNEVFVFVLVLFKVDKEVEAAFSDVDV